MLSFNLSGFTLVDIKKSSEIQIVNGKEYYIHIIEKGHTLYSLARIYKLTIKEIISDNPAAKDRFLLGQVLLIPVNKNNNSVDKSQRNSHQKKSKTKLPASFKKKKDGKIPLIRGRKKNVNRRQRKKESIVLIKEQDRPPIQLNEHIVKAGENLYRLAIKYRLKNVNELKQFNPGLTDRIYVGDRIKIPIKKKKDELILNKVERRRKLSRLVETDQVEVLLIDKKVKELMPGSSSNVVIMLVNGSEKSTEFKLKINVPHAWSLLTDYSTVRLAKKSEQIKVLSFYIQNSTKVGADEIIVEAFNITKNEKLETLKIPVIIKPKYAIEVELLDSPDYVFSGDSLNVNFIIRNLSNIKVDIDALVVNEKLIQHKMYTIEKDSFINVSVAVSTFRDFTYLRRKSVSLTATIVEQKDISVIKSFAFDIIPSNAIRFDAYDRLPIRITGLLVSNNSSGERVSGYMFDISAKGLISNRKKRFIDFHFRRPSNQGNPLFGLSEEYYLKYASDKINLVIGDNTFRLSDLTESARYGRGVGLDYSFNHIKLSAFYNLPKYYPELKNVSSVSASYFPSEKIKIDLGYLKKTFVSDSLATLMTLSGSIKPLKWANIDFEYAIGKTTEKSSSAYKASLRINKLSYRSYLNYTWADIDFPGYFSNSRYLSAGVSTSIIPKSNLSINYEFNHSNLALDTLYSNAPLSANLSFSGMFRIKKNHSIGFALYMRKREDRMDTKLFNYEELSGRFTLQSRIKRFELNLYCEYGKLDNLLEPKRGELTNVFKSYLSLLYKLNKSVSLDAFVNYQGGKFYQAEESKAIFYGASLNASIKQKLDMLIEYQSDFTLEEYNKDRSLLSSRIKYSLNRNHHLGLSVNYNLVKNTLNKKDLSIVFQYNYIINIPFSKKKNVGSLKGRVINKGVENIEGIVFTLAGNKAFTDKNGCFEFPVVKVGSYFLLMDNANTGLNTIAEIAGPYKIEILPGIVYDFEISLTKSARISGEISIQEDKNKNTKDYVPIKEKLGNLIIEVSKGKELYRMYSDKNGAFSFEDLRIGKWQLKIYENGISEGYQLLTKLFQIELSSGQEKKIKVLVKKKTRKIKFQKPF